MLFGVGALVFGAVGDERVGEQCFEFGLVCGFGGFFARGVCDGDVGVDCVQVQVHLWLDCFYDFRFGIGDVVVLVLCYCLLCE